MVWLLASESVTPVTLGRQRCNHVATPSPPLTARSKVPHGRTRNACTGRGVVVPVGGGRRPRRHGGRTDHAGRGHPAGLPGGASARRGLPAARRRARTGCPRV